MDTTQVFVNLPSSDLERAKTFYTALGCEINPLFTDENAACVVWTRDIYFMILERQYFATFSDKPIVDPDEATQVSVSFSLESRDAVDAVIAKGVAAGGTEPKPAQDHGFMYARDLDDPDGNSLGFLYMAPDVADTGPAHVASTAEAG